METLSIRAKRIAGDTSLLAQSYMLVKSNQYDDIENPTGICNLGIAENQLCQKELVEKLKSLSTWKCHYNYYPMATGELVLKQELCDMFQKMFKIEHLLDPNRMLISSGLSSTLVLLSYLIADPNDIFLISAPYYSSFDFDLAAFTSNEILQCPLLEQDNGNFRLSVDIFRRGYDQAVANKRSPRAIIIINPQNPLGDIYYDDTIQPILEFAAEKQLHIIFDEIYAFSVFNNETPFQSILSYKNLVDPKRTHFLWSFSKDFGLSGARVGVLYAGCKELCMIGAEMNYLVGPSCAIQETLSSLLSDRQWICSYIEINRTRLTERYQLAKERLQHLDQRIQIRPSKAGLFLWMNFQQLMHQVTFEEEMRLFQIIFDHGVYISSGHSFGCSQPGWFRLVFSVKPSWLDEGLRRLKAALNTYHHGSTTSS